MTGTGDDEEQRDSCYGLAQVFEWKKKVGVVAREWSSAVFAFCLLTVAVLCALPFFDF